jgi:hypothetical protein
MHIPSYWQTLMHESDPASTSAFRAFALLLATLEKTSPGKQKGRQKGKGRISKKLLTAEIGELPAPSKLPGSDEV